MKLVFTVLLFCGAMTAQTAAQTGALDAKAAEQLTTRMLQLAESTAVSVPGLVRLSEAVQQSAAGTLASLKASPRSPAITYRFIAQINAYLALSDSLPRPYPFPETAGQQFAELRESVGRLQQHFEGLLAAQNQSAQALNADPVNRARYADADTKLLAPGALPRVVFMGDSITDGWRLNEYFTGRDFVNRGIGGQTTLQMLGRFQQDVVALHPKAVLILGGTNDFARGISPGEIEDNLAMMAQLAKANGIQVLLASILPVSDYHKDVDPRYEMTKARPPALIVQVNAWMKTYCSKQGAVYVDYYQAMVDTSGQMQPDLADDGLHPNAKGYRVMSPIALEGIGRGLNGVTEDKQQPKRRFKMLGN